MGVSMRLLSVFVLVAVCFVCSSGSVASRSAAEQPDISSSGSKFLEICSDIDNQPNGDPIRITTFATSSSIEAVNAAGEVVFTSGNRRYWASPTTAPVDVPSSLGHALFACGGWYVIMANTAFQIAGTGAGPGCEVRPPEGADAAPP